MSNYTNEDYNNAIKLWLIRNNYEIRALRKRHHQRDRNNGLVNDVDFIQFVNDVHFSSDLEGAYSELTPGWEEPNITFKYKSHEYKQSLTYIDENSPSVFSLIKACVDIMDELKALPISN